MSGIAFQNVEGLRPNRTRFDWAFSKKFDIDFGWIVPIYTQFCLPGDYFDISANILLRCLPLVSPVIHRGQIKTDFVFIPKRIIDDCNSRPGTGNPAGDPLILGNRQPPANRFNWELFITGGFDGNDAQTHPRWLPTPCNEAGEYWGANTTNLPQNIGDSGNPMPTGWGEYTLWDYLQYPAGTLHEVGDNWASPVTPLDDLRRCYNLFYNEYFRDETLYTTDWLGNPSYKTPTGEYTVLPWDNEQIQFSAYLKDYFTSALPFQQRGISPALPLSGDLAIDWSQVIDEPQNFGVESWIGVAQENNDVLEASNVFPPIQGRNSDATSLAALTNALNKAKVDLTQGLTYDIADFRLTFQMQKWLERNARAGVRINEWTLAHWGKTIGDRSLFRPEYLGGSRQPIIFSEILQTSESADTVQGTLTGHGISAAGSHIGKYECNEYGYIIGVLRVMPDPAYTSQGFKRTNLYTTRYDFPQAEFVNLSEQDITNAEIYIAGDLTDNNLFGYQGIYDELRTQEDQVCGAMRTTLNFWHMNRVFTTTPILNRNFIECNRYQELRRIFFEQTKPGMLVDVEFTVKAIRPLPEIAMPGLIDHH